ncbi:MAG: hypothetical protein ACO3VQ_05430, partial [Ilumatobacteraceae bacterium]
MSPSTRKKSVRTLLVLAASASLIAACGGGDDAAEEAPVEEAAEAPAEESAEAPAEEAASDSASLADVCPETLVIQTDWHTEAEHGALYNLLGDDYTVEKDRGATVGPMTLDGVELGINFEIREGGPAIGFSSPGAILYSDDSVHLAYANTDFQILSYQDTPLLSVVAPLEKNPQMIMW